VTHEAGLRAFALPDHDALVVASWGRATTFAIRWLAARQGLDAAAPLGELRSHLVETTAPPDQPMRVVRLAVDPYRWTVEAFLTSLRTREMRAALELDDQYSFRQFLHALVRARHEQNDASPAWVAVQAAAVEADADPLEVIDIDDPEACQRLGASTPDRHRRRTTNLDRVVADDPFVATDDPFVAPRSVYFHDHDTVSAVNQLCAYELDQLGFSRHPAGAAGGPPPRPAPARPGQPDLVAPQARVGDIQRRKRQLLSRGYDHLTRELATPGTRPMVFRHHDLILVIAGRAASTFAVRWFLHHNQVPDQPGRWPHELRTRVVYPSDWHRDRVREVVACEPLAPVLRFARDPYRRAVSAYLHSLYQPRPRRSIAAALDITIDDGFSFHDYLRVLADLVPEGRCDPHAYLQFHPIEYLAPATQVFRVEDGGDRLRQIEHDLGLTPTSDEDQAALRATAHQARYTDSSGHDAPNDAAQQVFVPPVTPDDPVPRAPAFYDETTIALVDAIYASDFDRLGYPRRPVGEAGS